MKAALFCLFSTFSLTLSAQAAPLAPAQLSVNEGREAPLGFHDAVPSFSWKMQDDRPGARQTAYQILATNPRTQEVWDSGKVLSSQSVYVPYQGPALQSRDQLRWRVRYWDQEQSESPWSEWTKLELGLLSNENWKGKWINQGAAPTLEKIYHIVSATYGDPKEGGLRVDLTEKLTAFLATSSEPLTIQVGNPAVFPPGDLVPHVEKTFVVTYRKAGHEQTTTVKDGESVDFPAESTQPVPTFQRTFTLENAPENARLYLTSRGIFEASLNGQKVGDDFMTPGWTNYHEKIETLTYDVGSLLRAGENELRVKVAKGWYAGTILDSYWGEVPELLAQLECDGEVKIVTDESWQVSTASPIVMADIYNGEDYDAHRRITPESFRPVETKDVEEKPLLRPKAFQTVKITKEVDPVNLDQRKDGSVIYNLNQNIVGTFAIKIPVKRNQLVTITVAEMLNADGSLYRENYRKARSLATYLPAKDGVIEYRPSLTFFGFQYAQIEGYDAEHEPQLDWIRGLVLHSDFQQTGSFTSSHERLNKLQSNIEWSQRGNFLDIPTDCPQRDERLGWTGDAQAFSPVALYNFDTHAFFTSWMESMRIDQHPDGMVPNIIPPGKYKNWGNAPGWGDAIYLIPWQVYLRTGDRKILSDNYEAIKLRLSKYESDLKGNLIQRDEGFGDWLQPILYHGTEKLAGPENPATGQPETRYGETPRDFLGSCFFARGCQIAADCARILNKSEDEKRYRELAQGIAAAVASTYFDKEGKTTLPVETQTAYVMPLAFDLLPADLATMATEHLVARIEADGNRLNTGFIGTALLCQTLDKVGELETASKVLFTSEYPSWFYSIDQGATTIWERWNSYTKADGFGDAAMNSFNHYAYGAVGEFLYERLAGLAPDPANPGYKHILIQPAFEGHPLTQASATLETRYGTASNSWKKTDAGIEMTTVIPPNTTATITLPKKTLEVTAGTHTFLVK
ncbi:family 78 glycoside hydrolase catalytic domain [Roseibacillus persicicus]|uniref:alpha-L-rhamnosidase n=1 Tax=Roseibacillus persicicus TaxID=454148 RepID=A0A918TRR8_9BACT|nr:family 78 glycoside hydrolase catalytic domain [Roseibacillus persicicus]GHC60474.1 hypothetical protein GCM10007100_29770 [Roseibacillus persicicus]